MKLGTLAPLLVALACGCSEPTDRAPATCVGCGVVTGGGVGMPGSGGGAGMGGGQAGTGAETGVSLTGNVILLDDFGFQSGPLVDDAVALRAQARSGGSVTGSWDGMTPFLLENVLSDPLVWVSLTPVTQANPGLPTLVPANTSRPDANGQVTLNLGLVDRVLVDTVLDILTVPVVRDESKAILILRTTRTDGTPLAGVTATAASAETVVYGSGGTFTDDATATDASGLVLLVNVPASAWPGTLVGVTFSGAIEGGADVRALTGAVTLEGITP